MVIIFALLMIIKVQAVELYIDQFHGLQNRLVLSVEQPIDIQETLSIGVNVLDGPTRELNYQMQLWELAYRRYIRETTQAGVFYSFGVRTGIARLNSEGVDEEQELAVMPFYDIGIKSALGDRWHHILKVEAGYLILYTRNININHMLGLQFTPFFSFGYNLD